MEELVFFLSQRGIDASLHIVYENQRIEGPSSIFGKPKFGSLLETGDPPHWMTGECSSTSLTAYPVTDEVAVIYPFTFTISEVGEHDNQTDSEGWRYSTSFQGSHWGSIPSRNSCVRQRKWERLVVLKHQYHHTMCVLPEYYRQLTEFRCLHPLIIKASLGLKKYSYQIHLVMENQRMRDGVFSREYLDPDIDPPAWCVGSEGLLDDPTHCDADNIQAYDEHQCTFDRTKGFDLLHDFIYILYPNKDTFGWEYNHHFFNNDDSKWQSQSSRKDDDRDGIGHEDERGKELCVRRRVWFRTVVSDNDLAGSRKILRKYMAERPSGVSSDGTLLLLNSFGTKWRKVTATLSGSRLLLHDPSKQMKQFDEFDLCDHVMSELFAKDCPGKTRGFGLRLKRLSNVHSFDAIFSAEGEEDHRFWIEKIDFQMCQVDFARSLLSGPPRTDPVLLVSDMWKRRKSKIPQSWGLKTFELHQSGYLKIYNGVHLKNQYDVINCKFSVKLQKGAEKFLSSEESLSFCGDGTRFEFDLSLRNGEVLYIRAMSRNVMNKWLTKLMSEFNAEESMDFVVDGVGVMMGGCSYSSKQVIPERGRTTSSSLILGHQYQQYQSQSTHHMTRSEI